MEILQNRLIRTSFITEEENASTNPAVDAVIPGVDTAMTAVTPTATLDRRLNRTESQRFTIK